MRVDRSMPFSVAGRVTRLRPNCIYLLASIATLIQALEERAFPSSPSGSSRPSLELTSPPSGQTFRGWVAGKLSTSTPPLH